MCLRKIPKEVYGLVSLSSSLVVGVKETSENIGYVDAKQDCLALMHVNGPGITDATFYLNSDYFPVTQITPVFSWNLYFHETFEESVVETLPEIEVTLHYSLCRDNV